MNFEIIPWLWDETDGDVRFVMPHYDVRAAVYVDTNQGDRIANETFAAQPPRPFGANIVYNDTDTRLIYLNINGDDPAVNRVTLTGVRCIGTC